MFQQFLNFLFPEPCVHCGQGLIAHPMALCLNCLKAIPTSMTRQPKDDSICEWFALGHYQGPLGASIRRAKYRPDLCVMNGVAKRLASAIQQIDIDVVVSIAPTPSRLIRRGFNPSHVLAKAVAKQLNVPHLHPMKRIDHRSQVSKTRSQRRESLNRFSMNRSFHAESILLVDDVRTTGSTLRECGKLLRMAGAGKITAMVAASASLSKKD